MSKLKINHIAVWVNVVILHALGFVWYGPLFGDPWMEMVGITLEEAESGSANMGMWITNTVSTIITVYALAWLFTKMNVDSAVKGLLMGLLIAIAFNFMPAMSGNMFEQSPYWLAYVTGGFNMVGWGIAGLILGAWKKYV
jgi:hypothetical protein